MVLLKDSTESCFAKIEGNEVTQLLVNLFGHKTCYTVSTIKTFEDSINSFLGYKNCTIEQFNCAIEEINTRLKINVEPIPLDAKVNDLPF
jgi:hypothetical protein